MPGLHEIYTWMEYSALAIALCSIIIFVFYLTDSIDKYYKFIKLLVDIMEVLSIMFIFLLMYVILKLNNII